MPDVFEFWDYKEYLKAFISQQPYHGRGIKAKMARLMGCRASFVSQVMTGSLDLSLEQSETLIGLLTMTEEQAEYFLSLVTYSRAGTATLKNRMRKRLEKLRAHHLQVTAHVPNPSIQWTDKELGIYYGSWLPSAVHVLTSIPGFTKVNDFATHLSLDPALIQKTLTSLEQLGVVKRMGERYERVLPFVHVPRGSIFTSAHHLNWRTQALRALQEDREDNMHFTSVFALSQNDFDRIKGHLLDVINKNRETIRESPEEVTGALCMDFFCFGPKPKSR